MAEGLRSVIPGWLGKVGQAATPPDPGGGIYAGKRAGLPGWLLRTGNDPNVANPPSITSTTTVRNGTAVTVTGTNFGGTQGTVYLGTVGQTVTSWANTSITFTCDVSYLKFGQTLLRVILPSTQEATFLVSTLPSPGYAYVDLVAPLAPTDYRITAVPDLAAGDQLEYGNVSPVGDVVTVYSDASFQAEDSTIDFSVRVNDGSTWSPFVKQTLKEVGGVSQTAAKINGTWREISYPAVKQAGLWKTPLAMYVKQAGTWKRAWPATNPAPYVRLTSPTNGSVLPVTVGDSASTIKLSCYAVDDVGFSKVEYWAQKSGGALTKIAESLDPTNALSHTRMVNGNTIGGEGSYTIFARAFDDVGAYSDSPVVAFSIDALQRPVVSFINPPSVPNRVFGTVQITASMSDADGTITSGVLARQSVNSGGGYTQIASVTNPSNPHTFTLDTVGWPNDVYDIRLTATDNNSLTNASSFWMETNNLATPTVIRTNPSPTYYEIDGLRYAQVQAGTDQVSGNWYMIASTNPATPTAAQIEAGRDAGNVLVGSNQKQTTPVSALATLFNYQLALGFTQYIYVTQKNAQGGYSNVVGWSVYQPLPLSVTLTSTSAYGFGSGSGAQSSGSVFVQTDQIIASVSNAVGAYTISWEKISGADATVNNPSANVFYFSRTATAVNGATTTLAGTYRLVVTDSGGNIAYSPLVNVTTNHTWTQLTAISVLPSTQSLYGYNGVAGNSARGTVVTSAGPLTLTLTNHTNPVLVQWQLLSGDAASVVDNGNNSFTFVRTVSNIPAGTLVSKVGVYRALVTDAVGNSGTSANVTVTTDHDYDIIEP